MFITSIASDTITLTQTLRDGESLVSARGEFQLRFFSPGNSTNRRYLGISFYNISDKTVVWVANRERPLLDTSGVLQITNESILVLRNGTGGVIWQTNSSRSVQNPVAQILDSGNLVVRDENDEQGFLWQSFDYPCDSQLPGMKLGIDLVTGFERFLTSWKSSDDPSPGSYTYKFDPHGYPQPRLYQDSVQVYRDGPWNGVWFSGNSLLGANPNEIYQFVFNEKELYYVYDVTNTSRITNRVLYSYGTMQRVVWDTRTNGWAAYLTQPNDNCDVYEVCGVFGICNLTNSLQCQCMEGYEPKARQDWERGVWVDGCTRSVSWNCSIDNGFRKYSNVKLPDTRNSSYSTTMTLDECKEKCLKNCSCVAYANLDVTLGGIGCLLWFNPLVDVRVLSGVGQDLYVRITSSGSSDGKNHIWIAVCSSLLAVVLISCSILVILWRRRRLRREAEHGASERQGNANNNEKEESELPIFAFHVIANATNFFSYNNKLGEGGFGSVYKGMLDDGQEIAVKRLSKDSKQGLDEFKNEALFIAKLQHRNLVKLMGCCIEAEERMLIYEYMPNKSLDYFIFDAARSALLDWPKRFEIIKGIARGLLYLHQDSRLRIVHRDLKASNILLDSDMNAKISDFGMARSFDGSEDEAKTKRVVGTYGYMPPEYTIDGLFSVKSDVFSFGVVVLEIVSGKTNRGFNHSDHHHNLLGHTWMLFREGAALDIVDPSMTKNSSSTSQMQRSIHIGLLCVQRHPEDRPSMSLVTVMLSSDSELPEPKEPGFFIERNMPQESVSTNSKSLSNDQMSITLLSGR